MWTRREFVARGLGAAVALRSGTMRAQSDATTVRTSLGTLRGEMLDAGLRVFRGVPFAQPPLGPLRFRAPVAARPWTGVRDATRFAHAAVQMDASQVPQSEDCLYLNVWTPAGEGPWPVFVWIHGGGFVGGYSFDPMTDGAAFARNGVVCVTVAYRLGVLGFLDVEPVLGSEYAGSANNGVRDLLMALTWVQRNIAAFGGDPARVTVGGESAGAKLTDILMGVPSAKGLFHQAISESGGAERVSSKAQAAEIGQGFAAAWSRQEGVRAAGLRDADPRALMRCQRSFMDTWPKHFPLRPEVDGTVLPHLPVDSIAAGSSRGVRLLLGTNLDESAFFLGPDPTRPIAARDLGNIPLDRFTPVLAEYDAVYSLMTEPLRKIRAVTAEEYWIPSERVIEAHVRAGGEAWMYRLDFAESSGRLKGFAYHSMDVGMVWGDPHTKIANAAAEDVLGAQMHAAWVAFIEGGPPAAPGLPAWPAFTLDARRTMLLNSSSSVVTQPDETERRLWNGVE